MIAIIDYGMGNLHSVQKAFEKIGARTKITRLPAEIINADRVVLPGVGAMAPAMQKLQELFLTDAILKAIRAHKPFLGICLGMQLLFDKSREGGYTDGLQVFKGTVERFTQGKVPHMGWNQIKFAAAGSKMFAGLEDGTNVYFCHSYYAKPLDGAIAAGTTSYGIDFTCAVSSGNIWGVQFHPEKSQRAGLKILENFANL